MSYCEFEKIVKRNQGQPWFLDSYRGFARRRFATEPLLWIRTNIPKDANILEIGSGAGILLYWLAVQGFTKLHGFDYDPATVAIANEIISKEDYPVQYWQDNGIDPQKVESDCYNAILSIDWMYLRNVPDFDMSNLLDIYRKTLKDGGVFLLELVDEKFNEVPWNRYLSSDREKPENDRRPSEYKLRFSSEQIGELARNSSFKVIHTMDFTNDSVPRKVHVLQKNENIPLDDYLFRNDDVSFDTPLADFKNFCSIFHKYGFKQLHGVNLFGRTACRFRYGGLAVEYKNVPNISLCENDRIRGLAQAEQFSERRDLIEYLNSIPDEVALHGLYHIHHNRMTYEEQLKDFREGLAILYKLFPRKKIRYFIAPFNEANEDTYRAASEIGLDVLTIQNGVHFEKRIEDVHLLPHVWYRYHHHRFYRDSKYKSGTVLNFRTLEKALSKHKENR